MKEFWGMVIIFIVYIGILMVLGRYVYKLIEKVRYRRLLRLSAKIPGKQTVPEKISIDRIRDLLTPENKGRSINLVIDTIKQEEHDFEYNILNLIIKR